MKAMRSVVVFCGATRGLDERYSQLASRLGECLGSARVLVVTGGGPSGLMGLLVDSVISNGGRAMGVLPRVLFEREGAHRGLVETRIVETLAERMSAFMELADAFIGLPGGWGTLSEVTEVIALRQLGLHKKPVVLIDSSWWSPVSEFGRRAIGEGFAKDPNIVFSDDVSAVMSLLHIESS